ncbi:MAG: tRNA pseudouridine(55) synthase TruB [Candidatus Aegiribacteria sp.]|nr:tRNA pseudouridine(55) synthase TruB [Candidatus Aegiribacteria sp.]
MTSPGMTGAAYLLDKSAGIYSRRAASRVAKQWGYRKYGHAGTLDPDATGLLIVLLGRATRLSRFISSSRKTYSFGIELGIRTDTDDTGGTVLEKRHVPPIVEEDILKVIRNYTGTINQKVPDYSAVRVDGVRAYSLARKGLKPSTPVREVYTENWKIEELMGSRIRLAVTVSSGTYIRAFARDIGNELGTGGAAFDIRRTSIGAFSIEEASKETRNNSSLLSMSDILRDYRKAVLDEEQRMIVSHGGNLKGHQLGTVVLLDKDDNLLAVAEGDGSILKPLCVFAGS